MINSRGLAAVSVVLLVAAQNSERPTQPPPTTWGVPTTSIGTQSNSPRPTQPATTTWGVPATSIGTQSNSPRPTQPPTTTWDPTPTVSPSGTNGTTPQNPTQPPTTSNSAEVNPNPQGEDEGNDINLLFPIGAGTLMFGGLSIVIGTIISCVDDRYRDGEEAGWPIPTYLIGACGITALAAILASAPTAVANSYGSDLDTGGITFVSAGVGSSVSGSYVLFNSVHNALQTLRERRVVPRVIPERDPELEPAPTVVGLPTGDHGLGEPVAQGRARFQPIARTQHPVLPQPPQPPESQDR